MNETESVIALNIAEARYHNSDADLNEEDIKLRKIEVQREKDKDSFDTSQDYRHGYISFSSEINDTSQLALSSALRRLTRMCPKQPISVELNSPGGSIMEGFAAIDTIASVEAAGCPVTMIVRGQACSMAAVVLQSASKRIIGPNSFLMLHKAAFGIAPGTKSDEVEDSLEEARMMETQIYNILAKRGGKTAAWWRKKLSRRKDVWWTAEQALADGLVDTIA